MKKDIEREKDILYYRRSKLFSNKLYYFFGYGKSELNKINDELNYLEQLEYFKKEIDYLTREKDDIKSKLEEISLELAKMRINGQS